MAAKKEPGHTTVSENRRARFEYHIVETYEAGIELRGTEVKSLRRGQSNIAESYAADEGGNLVLVNSYIPEYQDAGKFFQHEPRRPRRLLMHAAEIKKLRQAIARKGMTIVPLELYFNDKGRAKLKLALAEGKNHADKRQASADRDWNRQKARLMREKG